MNSFLRYLVLYILLAVYGVYIGAEISTLILSSVALTILMGMAPSSLSI